MLHPGLSSTDPKMVGLDPVQRLHQLGLALLVKKGAMFPGH